MTTKDTAKAIQGNSPIATPFNAEREIRRFRQDPLQPLLKHLGESLVQHGESGRYYRAYDFYALSLERVFRHISIGRRFQSQVRSYYGGRRSLTDRQKAVSRSYRDQRPFFELDFTNYMIHARILLDRAIAFSRRFLDGEKLPSFTSFAEHKKFLKRHPDEVFREHGTYREHIVEHTDWFEMPLKFVRDKLLVHTPPKHFLLLGYSSYHDLEMMFIPAQRDKPDLLNASICLKFSVRRLARDIESFLAWYNDYALTSMRVKGAV